MGAAAPGMQKAPPQLLPGWQSSALWHGHWQRPTLVLHLCRPHIASEEQGSAMGEGCDPPVVVAVGAG